MTPPCKNITSLEDLAIFGATPAYKTPLHVGAPNLGNRSDFHRRIDDIFDSRWLTNNGAQVQEFEKVLADYLGVKHVIACCNATVGLMLAIRALDLRGEVLVPSYTFVATPHSLAWQGITPVFCDIHPSTLTIDPADIEKRITPRTTGILGVHLWGNPCDIDAIKAIADKHHLKVIYDAAHAFACTYQGKLIGSYGDIEVFSFHATKFLNAGEGGAITTNSDEYAKIIRFKINFGFHGYDNIGGIGTNGKMNELSAALGLTNFECIDQIVYHNAFISQTYQHSFAPLEGIEFIKQNKEKSNHQYVAIRITDQCTLSRDDLHDILRAENIMVRRYFYPGCHRQPCYASEEQPLLPHTDALANSVLCLPTGTATSPEDVQTITQIIHLAISNSKNAQKGLQAYRRAL